MRHSALGHSLRAFSLVELSIVLVILGLLVGGILAGQSLIRASELRAVSTEFSRWTTAMHAFRDKYFALPGDMSNATKFWGTAATCPGNNTQGSTTPATCDGNANGQIQITVSTANESYRFWQHLANAGLIEGTFSGVANHASTTNDLYSGIGFNIPASKLSGGGWTPYYLGTIADSSLSYYGGNYGNMMFYGAVTSYVSYSPLLKPEEAWNIDTKMDDGKVATGMVTGLEFQSGTASPCGDLAASASSLTNATYALSATGRNCGMAFKLSL